MKADVEIHADARRRVLDPRETAHTEPRMKSGVVVALRTESTA
jgi:hypothetical protein